MVGHLEDSDVLVQRASPGDGQAFGTFGELLQGVLTNNMDFLVTFPINRFARARFIGNPSQRHVTVAPAYKRKSKRLASLLLRSLSLPSGGELIISSDLPVGKGMASSSADLVATARAIGAFYNVEIPISLLHHLMAAIEPSDGVMHNGVVAFYHRKVEVRDYLGVMPPVTIVGTDEGGEVDTVDFNRIPKPFSDRDKGEYQYLLKTMIDAFRRRDVRTIGEVATRSSQLNEQLRPKATLDKVMSLCREIGGLGTAVAHSGTCLGILLSPDSPTYAEQLHIAQTHLQQIAGNVEVYQSLTFQEGDGSAWQEQSLMPLARHHW